MVLLFVFVVKHNESEAFSVQDALEAPMAAPAPRELPKRAPREPPKVSQMLTRCLRDQKKNLFGFWHQGYWYSFNFQKAWSMMSPFIQPVNCFESNLVLNHILNVGCWVGGRQGGPQGGQCQQNLTNQWGHTGGGKTPLHPSCGGCEVVARPQSNLGL